MQLHIHIPLFKFNNMTLKSERNLALLILYSIHSSPTQAPLKIVITSQQKFWLMIKARF